MLINEKVWALNGFGYKNCALVLMGKKNIPLKSAFLLDMACKKKKNKKKNKHFFLTC